MIEDLDETIRQLVKSEMPIKNSEIDISFDQPRRDWSSRLSKPTINFFLYDLRENPVLRQHQWEDLPPRAAGDPLAHRKRSPFRIDCFYMITTWAAESDDEHRLLSRCLYALFRNPIIPENRLIGLLKNQPYDIQARLASHDRFTNPAELWSAMDNEMRPSVSYIITISIDPWTEVTGPIVHSLTLRTGATNTLPHKQVFTEEGINSERVFIGGTVIQQNEKGQPDNPLAGIQVAIKGTGFFSTSDDQGHFVLGGLAPGEYTLIAWLAEGKIIEKKIMVPLTGADFDLLV